uniref:Fibronectin type-III domain-containing protein n=1 Tax=Stegastes partitus TaxID=144197 RepID=A0A3B4ZEQ0_9TELE
PRSTVGTVLCLDFHCTVVSQLLSGPSNVHLTSHNMDLVLRWEPPEGAAGGLLYTTEYSHTINTTFFCCINAFYFSCEKTCFLSTFTTLLFYFSAFIGPPTVSLFSSGATLEVGIQDPVFMISALRNVYNGATYNITYWKKDQNEKARSIYNIQQNRLVLNDLEPRTKYCVQVQINTDRNPNPSQPSSIICENTANETPWVAAVVAFVTMAVAVTLVVVAVVYWKSISQFLCPKDALPLHFKEVCMFLLVSAWILHVDVAVSSFHSLAKPNQFASFLLPSLCWRTPTPPCTWPCRARTQLRRSTTQSASLQATGLWRKGILWRQQGAAAVNSLMS